MICPGCQASVPEGARFCVECGTPLALSCPECGASCAPGYRFCGNCGASLGGAPSMMAGVVTAARLDPAPAVAPEPELRIVSVLFVDLVGFTSLAESRDSEDVRELLGRYFDRTRTIVERYGGTLEKFIGDAVMAVWGAPVALEDDAERAVRAALEIVDAVTVLSHEVGADELRARAGVVTGQAAAVENPGEGIVVGDRVNTAARVQAAAEPGSVFVDQVTRQITSGAILFEDAGEHLLKGKSEPLRLWRAVRVVAGAGGRGRDARFDAPFTGREADLRLLKELFHGALDRGVARLVAISGDAGVGKSRLLQELSNYTDGLARLFLWHTGRCLAHGEGVTYWALSEMVKQRLGIPEDAPDDEVSAKLSAGLSEWVPDPADREFVAPRLRALLGLSETDLGQAELFAGWRMFFERMAVHEPVVMVFEDMQWADRGLLEFIEQLVDWSAALPIFVVVLARPELALAHDGWPVGRRGATILQLEPLAADAVHALVSGLVEGLPRAAVAQIVERAQGVPLYAIEIVRALADRGVLTEREGVLGLDGELGELEVPPTLNALLAARLDALDSGERTVVKAMSVFGGAFAPQAAAALTDLSGDELDTVLQGLVRKQVLVISTDPLSPDRGHYGWAQGLLRTVAYELLSRRERKTRHLAAAAYLRQALANDGEEVAEVIASHHLAAYRAAGEDEDATDLRVATVAALRRAGQRAGTVGAPDVAQRLYVQASELSDDERERAELDEAAGEMAYSAGRADEALTLLERAAAAHEQAGRRRESLRLTDGIARSLQRLERMPEAIERVSDAVAALDRGVLDRDVAELNATLGRIMALTGDYAGAHPVNEAALKAAQALGDERLLCDGLGAHAVALLYAGRHQEAVFNFGAQIEIAERIGHVEALSSGQNNAGNLCMLWDLPGARGYLSAALAVSRRRGERFNSLLTAANIMYLDMLVGRWDEADQLARESLVASEQQPGAELMHLHLADLAVKRGELAAAEEHFEQFAGWGASGDFENRSARTAGLIGLRVIQGRPEEAVQAGLEMLGPTIERYSAAHDAVRLGWPDAFDAAMACGRLADAGALLQLLAERPPGHLPPYMHAHAARARGLLARADGEHDTAETELREAVGRFTELGYPYWLAIAQTDLADWLIAQNRAAETDPLLDQAIEALTALGAVPALARARELKSLVVSAAQVPH